MRTSLGRASFFLLAACAVIAGSARACKEPTQVTIDIRTLGFKCSELKKVTVVVAPDPQTAEDKWQYPKAEVGECQGDFEVGTLVITPSGDHGAVMVLASYSETPCVAPDYVNCIVARRQFSFIENVPLRLPITLEASCKNVPCNALSSCRSGTCVTSKADCSDDGTCASPAEPVIAEDGGTVAPPADATFDIPPNDNYVPPNDGNVPPVDGGSDAAVDAPIDAPADGGLESGPGVPGNDCPTSGGPQDCTLTNQVCCPYQVISCGTPGVAPGDAGDGGMTMGVPPCSPYPVTPYLCTGRKHCAQNEFCCGSTGSAQSQCVAGSCATFICNSDADCPSTMHCNQIQFMPPFDGGGGPIKRCGP